MSKERIQLGQEGEEIAVAYLKNLKYKILECNYRTAFGELDIVALEGSTYCFVEVKTRSSQRFGLPQEAVGEAKKRKLLQSAYAYLQQKRLEEVPFRFDVVSIIMKDTQSPQIELLKDAIEFD